ncbi:MAG: hypothetical protein H0V53_07150 [Rubrobacter sp.]|nr:hypothetical protein [Rubrobacter sp.]
MWDMDNSGEACEGVVECTALVLAEGYTELDGRITLFGVMDEIRTSGDGTSFVVYAKFEGCEHAGGKERWARFIVADEEGNVIEESEEQSVLLDGTEEPATMLVRFDLPEEIEDEERVLWIEAILDEETLSQTAIRLQKNYNV